MSSTRQPLTRDGANAVAKFEIDLGEHGIIVCRKVTTLELCAAGVQPFPVSTEGMKPAEERIAKEKQAREIAKTYRESIETQDRLFALVMLNPVYWRGPEVECPENGITPTGMSPFREIALWDILAALGYVEARRKAVTFPDPPQDGEPADAAGEEHRAESAPAA